MADAEQQKSAAPAAGSAVERGGAYWPGRTAATVPAAGAAVPCRNAWYACPRIVQYVNEKA